MSRRTTPTPAQVAAFALGLRLIDLERLTGIPASTASTILRGDRRPSRDEAERLANALGVEPDTLLAERSGPGDGVPDQTEEAHAWGDPPPEANR